MGTAKIRVWRNWRAPRWGIVYLDLFLAALCAASAAGSYPQGVYRLMAGLAIALLLATFLDTSWILPFMVVGVFLGMFLDPTTKRGPVDAQMNETVLWISVGTIAGFALGLFCEMRET